MTGKGLIRPVSPPQHEIEIQLITWGSEVAVFALAHLHCSLYMHLPYVFCTKTWRKYITPQLIPTQKQSENLEMSKSECSHL